MTEVMTQHTPGPLDDALRISLKTASSALFVQVRRAYDESECPVVVTWGDERTREQAGDLARLIAAAPEMLALLRNVVEDMDTIADHLSSLGKVARGSRVYISALIARISALIARLDGGEG